jgi:hypothetical protein
MTSNLNYQYDNYRRTKFDIDHVLLSKQADTSPSFNRLNQWAKLLMDMGKHAGVPLSRDTVMRMLLDEVKLPAEYESYQKLNNLFAPLDPIIYGTRKSIGLDPFA